VVDIGIVGSGFAGAAAALFLQRAGHAITLYEAVEAPAPVGAGILLQPTGQAVLHELGLLDTVAARAARVDELYCRTPAGRRVFHLRYGESAPGRVGFGLHRGVLFEALLGAVRGSPTDLRLGVQIVAVTPDGRLTDAAGRAHGPHQLVVVAEGAKSALRGQLFPEAWDAPYPWGALWFVAEDPEGIFSRQLHQVVETTRRMVGFLPTGRAPDHDAPLTSMFWSLAADELAAWRAGGLERWKQEILRFEPRAEPLLAQIQAPEQVLFAAYRDVRMPRWHRDRVVVIGDAAHAMSPQLGQGSNLALMDARALALALHGAPDVPAALATYQRLRRAHVRFYEWANRACTPYFQGRSRLRGWLRDTFFPAAVAVPYVRRRMVQTMCGVEQGILRSPMALPAGPAALLAPVNAP
jgi:2-polyprenyl-6-methoxyphenol hydroxylase-like FAD-dependent oxidoreductase